MRLDPKAAAVDLSRAAKQWQSLGEAKTAAGRNPEDHDLTRRLSSFLDAIDPFKRAQALWTETASQLRELGSTSERSAVVADQQAQACIRQLEFCGESFHELVLRLTQKNDRPPTLVQIRIAAYEFERNADNRPFEWLIPKFLADPVLRQQKSWGQDVDAWWLSPSPSATRTASTASPTCR